MQIKVCKSSPLNSPKTDLLEIVLMEDLKCCPNSLFFQILRSL